ncbi:MAG: RhuM family protein [Methanoregula sp.]|nr:RhuM family protein [Methanoregula sp.]
MTGHERNLIRNSTAEFLIFTSTAGEESIEVRYEDETIWLSQKMMAALFDVRIPTINVHLKNIYESGELTRKATIRKFLIVRTEGNRDVSRNLEYYSLDAIISVGYRINSKRATPFRQWATRVLREFAVKGYVLDKKRMENGTFPGKDYFERLLAEIREIRLSERWFYQKFCPLQIPSLSFSQS